MPRRAAPRERPPSPSPRRSRSTASRPAPAARRAASNEAGTGDGVLVEVAAAPQAMVLDALDVRRVVDDLELCPCRPARLERRRPPRRRARLRRRRTRPPAARHAPGASLLWRGRRTPRDVRAAPPFHDGTATRARRGGAATVRGRVGRIALPDRLSVAADRLAASRVSDRRTRPPLPSASWVSHARSASAPLGRLAARAGLVLSSPSCVALGIAVEPAPAAAQTERDRRHHADVPGPLGAESSSIPVRLGLKRALVRPGLGSVGERRRSTPSRDGSALASRDEFDATLAGQFVRSAADLAPAVLDRRARSTRERLLGAVRRRLRAAGQDPGEELRQVRYSSFPARSDYGGCDGVYPLQVSLVDTLTGLQTLDFSRPT